MVIETQKFLRGLIYKPSQNLRLKHNLTREVRQGRVVGHTMDGIMRVFLDRHFIDAAYPTSLEMLEGANNNTREQVRQYLQAEFYTELQRQGSTVEDFMGWYVHNIGPANCPRPSFERGRAADRKAAASKPQG